MTPRRKICSLFVRLVIVGGILAAASVSAAPTAPEGADSVDAAWAKAAKANDLEAVMACYAPDAVLWMPGMPEARGEKAIREAYRGLFAADTIQDAAMSDAHYQTVGSRSVGWGRFVLTLTPKSTGKAISMPGRFVVVAEKRNGRWVYVVDHASAEPSPAAEPATTPKP